MDGSAEETPIRRLHLALKSAQSGEGRELQVSTKLISTEIFADDLLHELNDVFFFLALQNEGNNEEVEALSLQARLPTLTRKMMKMCSQLQKKNPAPELAEDLDCFTGE